MYLASYQTFVFLFVSREGSLSLCLTIVTVFTEFPVVVGNNRPKWAMVPGPKARPVYFYLFGRKRTGIVQIVLKILGKVSMFRAERSNLSDK